MPRTAFYSFLLALTAANVRAQTTIDPAKASSWAGNTGWINWKPDRPATPNGAVVGIAWCAGLIYGGNFGWLNLGDGSPASGIAYSNTDAADFGVNHDGAGNLAGLAWGANIGWVRFEQTTGKPVVNLLTGNLSGYAWSANCGWINLGGDRLATVELDCPDTDGDGLADPWERTYFSSLTRTAAADGDGDGQSNLTEFFAGTNPVLGSSAFRISGASRNAATGQFTITFTSSPDRVYVLQTSTALSGWVDAGSVFLPGAGTQTTRTFALPAGPGRYVRVQARKPL